MPVFSSFRQREIPCWVSKFRNIWFYQEHCQMSLNWLRQAVILWKWANAFTAFSTLIEQPPCCLKPLNFFEAIIGWILPTLLIINMSLNVPGHLNEMLMQDSAVESPVQLKWAPASKEHPGWHQILVSLSNVKDTTWVRLVHAVQHHLHVIKLFYASYRIWKDLSLVFKSYKCLCLNLFLPGAVLPWRGWFVW